MACWSAFGLWLLLTLLAFKFRLEALFFNFRLSLDCSAFVLCFKQLNLIQIGNILINLLYLLMRLIEKLAQPLDPSLQFRNAVKFLIDYITLLLRDKRRLIDALSFE